MDGRMEATALPPVLTRSVIFKPGDTAPSCQKWIHRKCSGIKGSMYKVMKTFVCRGCMNPVTGTVRISVDIGVNANTVLVDKFCYLGDMYSVDIDADTAVETRIQIGWNKYR